MYIAWHQKKNKNEKVIILNLSKDVNFFFFNLIALSLMFMHATKRWGKQRVIDAMINNCNLKCTGSMLMSHLLEFIQWSCLWNIFSLFHHTETLAKNCSKIKTLILSFFFFFKVTYKIKIKFGWRRFWTNTLFIWGMPFWRLRPWNFILEDKSLW